MTQPSIFLSHSHQDKSFARRIAGDISRWGVHVWIDEAEILVGDSLISKIREGIDKVDYLGAILSPEAVNSRWVQEELDVAMTQQINGQQIKVLPLIYRSCNLPGFLLSKKFLDFTTDVLYQKNLPLLLHRLLGRKLSVTKILRPTLVSFAESIKKPILVLIIDNNEPSRRFHADLLRSHQLTVIESSDTDESLSICMNRKPNLVVSNMIRTRSSYSSEYDDYQWPEGLRLLYSLRKKGNDVAFIFLSATYAKGYIQEAQKLMVNAYIGREETPEHFLEIVENAITDTIKNE